MKPDKQLENKADKLTLHFKRDCSAHQTLLHNVTKKQRTSCRETTIQAVNILNLTRVAVNTLITHSSEVLLSSQSRNNAILPEGRNTAKKVSGSISLTKMEKHSVNQDKTAQQVSIALNRR